ncbi:MAG: baseplate J/gp47 family protein [Candidatus Aenigmatarchaeota archaeon]
MQLREPVFVEANWEKIYNEIIATYENITGTTLSKGQLEAVLLSIFAYRENLLRIAINETAKLNLLAYARDHYLDHLGALLGVYRLPARPAKTTLRFYISEVLDKEVIIPQGTRVKTQDDKVTFATTKTAVIIPGATYIDVPAEALEPGTTGNGYLQGQVNVLIDVLPFITKVENITITYGGADLEDDEHLRERIRLAPESFSNAGSKGAYIFWAKTAHQDINDVTVYSPSPGQVIVTVLMKDGEIPSEEILQEVKKTLNHEKVRPLTDQIFVRAPGVVTYRIKGQYWLYRSYSALLDSVKKRIELEINKFVKTQDSKLGRDIVPEQIIEVIQSIQGVYRVVLEEPSYRTLEIFEVSKCEEVSLNFAGFVDG